MKRKWTALAVAGSIGILGAAGVAALPASADDGGGDTSTAQEFLADRLERIKEALSGLVSDGTITQEQADAVADTLNSSDALRGPGGGMRGILGPGLDAAAEALDLTTDDLRDRLAGGETLAEIAEAEGVPVDDLVAALVAEAEERLAAAVEDERITQERADEVSEGLEERISQMVEEGFRFGGRHGMGPGGPESSTDDGATAQSSSFRTV